jgi:KDO2-lipid IV(A) lauroyltransferase
MRRWAKIGYGSLSMLARLLPLRLSYLIGETLAGAFFLLSGARRRVIADNIGTALGARQRLFTGSGYRLMLNFGRNVVDTFRLPHLGRRRLLGMVDIKGRERLDAAVAAGRGVILVTAHLGTWELGGAALAAMGYSITTVAGIQFSPALSPFIKKIKQDLGIDVVSSETGLRRIMKALSRGELVALHIDGDQFVGGTEVDFFARKARLPSGPAVLALRTGAAVVPAFAVRTEGGRITIFIEEEVPTENADEAGVTRLIVEVVETYIRRYPDQWCMFRPFWEARR